MRSGRFDRLLGYALIAAFVLGLVVVGPIAFIILIAALMCLSLADPAPGLLWKRTAERTAAGVGLFVLWMLVGLVIFGVGIGLMVLLAWLGIVSG